MITKVSRKYKLVTAIQIFGLVAMFILEKMTFGRGGLVHHLLFRKRQLLKLIPLTYLRVIGLILIAISIIIAVKLKDKEIKNYVRIENIAIFLILGVVLALNLHAPFRSYAYITVVVLLIALLQGLKYNFEVKKHLEKNE